MAMHPRASSRSVWPWVLVVLLLSAVGGGVALYQRRTSQAPKSWQAVFLTNGQVYFGHIARSRPSSLLLTDVYYLQVAPRLQPQDGATGSAGAAGSAPTTDLALVRLGDELHRPTGAMDINREHVLFTEEIRADGPVVQTIERMQKGVAAPSAAPASGVAPAEPESPAPTNTNAGKSTGGVNRR
ncbi:hypothetical protein HY632_00770 [Candidatus Uhrbacteria bacterium]|nr:hypothetical protein [Candidatus Uhrbacteria bacterium]